MPHPPQWHSSFLGSRRGSEELETTPLPPAMQRCPPLECLAQWLNSLSSASLSVCETRLDKAPEGTEAQAGSPTLPLGSRKISLSKMPFQKKILNLWRPREHSRVGFCRKRLALVRVQSVPPCASQPVLCADALQCKPGLFSKSSFENYFRVFFSSLNIKLCMGRPPANTAYEPWLHQKYS